MSLVDGLGAQVINGKFAETAGVGSVGKNASGGNTMDKDAFLKLLVAQMKYQDPLEPTSNTEFIAQYATFSQVEQLQNMSANMEMSRASSYVGQTVNVRTQMSNGEFREIEGRVDFVVFENGKALLSVDGVLYNARDVQAVIEPEYKMAYDLASAFARAMNDLPSLANLTMGDEEIIMNLRDGFNSMSGYQQSFIANALLEKLGEYIAKLEEIRPPDDND